MLYVVFAIAAVISGAIKLSAPYLDLPVNAAWALLMVFAPTVAIAMWLDAQNTPS